MHHQLAIKIDDCLIKPGKGFGAIYFGMTMDEAIKVLKQKPHQENINTDIVWEYFEFMQPFVDWTNPILRLRFDSLEDFKLTVIEVSSSQYAIKENKIELFGIKLANQTPKSLLLENTITEKKDNVKCVYSNELGLTIRFKNNRFDSFIMFALF